MFMTEIDGEVRRVPGFFFGRLKTMITKLEIKFLIFKKNEFVSVFNH